MLDGCSTSRAQRGRYYYPRRTLDRQAGLYTYTDLSFGICRVLVNQAQMRPTGSLVLLIPLFTASQAWIGPPKLPLCSQRSFAPQALAAKKPVKGKGATSNARGFGASGLTSASGSKLDIVRDKQTLAFLEWLEKGGAQISNLAIANIGNDKLRGVVALKVSGSHLFNTPLTHSGTYCCVSLRPDQHKQPFKKGDVILSIPYEIALDVTPAKGRQEVVTSAIQLLTNMKTMDLPQVMSCCTL